MNISEQPGRLLALIFFAPILYYKGYKYNDRFIILFSIILFFWELLWIVNYKPKVIEIS